VPFTDAFSRLAIPLNQLVEGEFVEISVPITPSADVTASGTVQFFIEPRGGAGETTLIFDNISLERIF